MFIIAQLHINVKNTSSQKPPPAGGGLEHLSVYRQRQRGGKKESFMHQHQEDRHQGEEARFRTKVTGAYRDCLTRQISEAVCIRRSDVEVLNSKSEWHQPALFQVQHEIRRGWEYELECGNEPNCHSPTQTRSSKLVQKKIYFHFIVFISIVSTFLIQLWPGQAAETIVNQIFEI